MPAMPTSLFLDPVLNDANVDIWVLTNLYDTLLSPRPTATACSPGLATKWETSDDGMTLDADPARRRQVLRRLADDRRRT